MSYSIITSNILWLTMTESEAVKYSTALQQKVLDYAQKIKGDGWEIFASPLTPYFVKRKGQIIQYDKFENWLNKLKKKK